MYGGVYVCVYSAFVDFCVVIEVTGEKNGSN